MQIDTHTLFIRIMASKGAHTLIPMVCECVTLQGKEDFEDGIKVSTLRGGDYPELSWLHLIIWALKIREPLLLSSDRRKIQKWNKH